MIARGRKFITAPRLSRKQRCLLPLPFPEHTPLRKLYYFYGKAFCEVLQLSKLLIYLAIFDYSAYVSSLNTSFSMTWERTQVQKKVIKPC